MFEFQRLYLGISSQELSSVPVNHKRPKRSQHIQKICFVLSGGSNLHKFYQKCTLRNFNIQTFSFEISHLVKKKNCNWWRLEFNLIEVWKTTNCFTLLQVVRNIMNHQKEQVKGTTHFLFLKIQEYYILTGIRITRLTWPLSYKFTPEVLFQHKFLGCLQDLCKPKIALNCS